MQAMMDSELILGSIPLEFQRSYHVFKQKILTYKIMQAIRKG